MAAQEEDAVNAAAASDSDAAVPMDESMSGTLALPRGGLCPAGPPVVQHHSVKMYRLDQDSVLKGYIEDKRSHAAPVLPPSPPTPPISPAATRSPRTPRV